MKDYHGFEYLYDKHYDMVKEYQIACARGDDRILLEEMQCNIAELEDIIEAEKEKRKKVQK